MKKTVRVYIRNETNSGNRKGWTKWVQSVDTTKTDGYAFIGPFLNDGEVDLPVGAVIIEKTPEGSAKNGWYGGICRVVVGCPAPNDGKGTYDMNHDKCFSWKETFLSFRDHVAETLQREEGRREHTGAQEELSKSLLEPDPGMENPEDIHREKVLKVIGLMRELGVSLEDLLNKEK